MLQPDPKAQGNAMDDFPYTSWERVYQQHALHGLPWDTPEAHPLLSALFKDHYAKAGARAIDLGCGTGASSRLLARLGYQVDAWDISATAIGRARMLSRDWEDIIKFIAGNALRHALISPNRYDLVLDFLFLHQVQDVDIEAYFSGIRSSVRTGGRYVVGVIVQTGDIVKRPSFFSDGEVRYWTLSQIELNLGPDFVCGSVSYGNAGSPEHNYPFGLFMFTKGEIHGQKKTNG